MDYILQNLIDMPDDFQPYEPHVERAPIDTLIRPPVSDREEVLSRARTSGMLLASGMEASMDDREEQIAAQEFHHLLQQKPMQTAKLTKPGIVLKLAALLSEYDHKVVRDAEQMRTYVTNRLLEESSEAAKPSDRLRALEALGKISGVDLFTERTEITIKSVPTEVLEAQLHEKLRVLLPEEFAEILNEADPIDLGEDDAE